MNTVSFIGTNPIELVWPGLGPVVAWTNIRPAKYVINDDTDIQILPHSRLQNSRITSFWHSEDLPARLPSVPCPGTVPAAASAPPTARGGSSDCRLRTPLSGPCAAGGAGNTSDTVSLSLGRWRIAAESALLTKTRKHWRLS